MVTIIKNQLLKHLSRYTKNLSPEQISLSALRGSGELADLTLDEDLLTELLELPTWLRISAASCNRATFRIQWTKLKTVPILLSLDEVHVALEVCVEPRVVTGVPVSSAAPGKYSFIHKVIDGISLSVNAVRLDFSCDAFTASVQVSRMTVESRTPSWTRGDLRLTRLKQPDTGQLLIFKEMEWQTARIEARAREPLGANLPPLRLLTGQSRCRITIKKRLSDCAIMGSRLVLQPEPLAWALTDGQLRAAMTCGAALATPAKRATHANTRAKAERKMKTQAESESEVSQSKSRSIESTQLARLFAKHNVRETSYHILAPRIDLHLCDDPGLGRSDKPSLSGGGALQVTLLRLQADFFPYHPANGDRKHWPGYRETATPHSQWLSQALSSFRGELLEFLDPRPGAGLSPNPPGNIVISNKTESVHFKPTKTENNTNHVSATQQPPPGLFSSSAVRSQILQQLGKLMTTCLILRIDDFTIYKVSTGAKTRGPVKPLVCGEKATLPGDAGIFHAELTQFYYPGEISFPVPPPKLYAQLSPVKVTIDSDSLVWLGAFLPHVGQALSSLPTSVQSQDLPFYMDVRMEAIMPKVVLEAGNEHCSQQRDRPKELQLSTARATLTNIREPLGPSSTGVAGSRADLESVLEAFQKFALSKSRFPSAPADKELLHEKFHQHALGLDDIVRIGCGSEALWKAARDVWCIRAEPLWADFCGARATAGKPSPLLDAVPLTLWAYFEDGASKIWALTQLSGLAGVQINHYQMLFVLRQIEKLSTMGAWLSHDARKQPGASEGSIILGAIVPQAEVTLVLPSTSPGQESSRDIDSAPPDSSSLLDYKPPSDAASAFHQEFGLLTAANQGSLEGCAPLPQSPIDELPPPSPGGHSLNFTSGFSSVKKGWSSFVTSIDGALSRDDARSDAASTASSDSERYIIVGLSGDTPDDADTAFREWEQGRSVGNVEVAAEVMERSSSPSERSVTSSGRRRDLVCTSTWRVKGISAVYQALSTKTSIKMIANNLQAEECASIPWDEFQSKFASRGRVWTAPSASSSKDPSGGSKETVPRLRLRLDRVELEGNGDKGLAHPSECLSDYEEKLEVRLQNLSLSLGMSTAMGIGEFAEDEITVAPIPLEVLIEDIHLHLVEDRPARNISSPSPVPLDLKLSSLCLQRDKGGVLHLLPLATMQTPDSLNPFAQVQSLFPLSLAPASGSSPSSSELEVELSELKANEARLLRENEELKKKLFMLSGVAEDNRDLRALADAAQNEAAALLADKHTMLTTIKQLQDQLAGVAVGGSWTSRPGKR